MSKFQLILTALFVIFIVAGVALFATFKSKDKDNTLPPITVWGTFPSEAFSQFIVQINSGRTNAVTVDYTQIDEDSFNKQFIESLARGQGPDAILIPQDLIARYEDKIIPIPNTVLTERDFKNTYIPQAELYLSQNKEVLAIPFTVDPLVMYWNRDMFTNAGIATPPKLWEDFDKIIPKINQKDANSNIRRSALSFGEFVNVTNARQILGALLIQAGNPVTSRGDASTGGSFISTLGDGRYNGSTYSKPAVEFFTQFANPRSQFYSWNRALPMSKSWFLSGSLATYFGFASELYDLRSKNPNIDFDVAELPQPKNGVVRATYGKMYGFSIVRTTQSAQNTFTVLQTLTVPSSLALLNKMTKLPPVRRDMIATGSTDPYQSIFFDSALISKSWLDVDPGKTNRIFQDMVESITSGRAESYEAIQTAHGQLDLSLQNP